LLRQYLTVVMAFSILFLLMNFIRIFIRPVRRQMDWFLQMINAMKQMSKGNFNVSLESNPRYRGQFGHLVTSFNEMASKLNQMEQMYQEFISNVSHEIQSPLTSITGFARALKIEDLSPETRKHYLDIIETEANACPELASTC
jgi:two-component system phosphate regulon sensor histidine kinase PhoR